MVVTAARHPHRSNAVTPTLPGFPIRALLASAVLVLTSARVQAAETGDSCVVAVRSATTDMLLLDADAMRVADKLRVRLQAADGQGRHAGQRIDVAITHYDKGSTTVRSMVRGPNDVHANMIVTVRDADDAAATRSLTLRETFSGIVVDGSSSRIGDIEDALVKAVAAALQKQG